MTSKHDKSRRRRWSAGAVFVATWGAVIVVALIVALVGIQLAGGASGFQSFLRAAAPYALLWRLLVYIVGGTLYIRRWRPRLRARQRQQADGGEAAHRRLIKIERMMVVALLVIEASNLPDLLAWLRG